MRGRGTRDDLRIFDGMRITHALLGVLAFGALVAPPPEPSGRLVRVYGDLAAADRVAVIVPGADVTVRTFDTGFHRPGGAARSLLAEASRLAPDRRLAVVAWLGYDSPPTISLDVAMDTAARHGATALRRTVLDLRARTTAPIALLCHSYGSVVCARAVPGLPVADLALFGSPGLTSPTARSLARPSGLPTASAVPPVAAAAAPLRVWAGLGAHDWIRFVPKAKLGPLGLGGTDPMSPAFGARRFEAGRGGHSDYFTPGSRSLRNLALIALGRPGEVAAA